MGLSSSRLVAEMEAADRAAGGALAGVNSVRVRTEIAAAAARNSGVGRFGAGGIIDIDNPPRIAVPVGPAAAACWATQRFEPETALPPEAWEALRADAAR
jgi:hypothetical protein